jgi:hypothetical protein
MHLRVAKGVLAVFVTTVLVLGPNAGVVAGQSITKQGQSAEARREAEDSSSLYETIQQLKAQLEKQQAQIDKLTNALEEKQGAQPTEPNAPQVVSLKPVVPAATSAPDVLLPTSVLSKAAAAVRETAPVQAQAARPAETTPPKPDNTPQIRIGLTLYPAYVYTQSPQSVDVDGNKFHPSNFDVQRSYINVTGQISHVVSFRITPDITRGTVTGATASTQNNLLFRIKYAFGQINLDDWSGKWKQTWVRFGANQTPLIDWEEGVYRYRFQGTTFTERVGTLTSSDYGASFHTMSPGNYLEIHTGVYNGPGYSSTAANEQKAVQTRLTFRPFAPAKSYARNIRVTSFYDWDQYARKDQKRRFVAEGLFEHPHIVAGIDYLDARDQTSATVPLKRGNGYGIWATPALKQVGKNFELLLRYDHWTPSRAPADIAKKQNMSIVGVSYWFPHEGNVATSMLLDWEVVKFPGTATPTQSRIAVHGYLNY